MVLENLLVAMSLIRYWRDLAWVSISKISYILIYTETTTYLSSHYRHASRELLIAYPNAKVILTTRDPDKWIEPVERSTYAVIHPRLWSILKMLLPTRNASPISRKYRTVTSWLFANQSHRKLSHSANLSYPHWQTGPVVDRKIALFPVKNLSPTTRTSENLLGDDSLSPRPKMLGNHFGVFWTSLFRRNLIRMSTRLAMHTGYLWFPWYFLFFFIKCSL